jgi:Domain of unknown function (DUF4178)
MTDAQGRPPVTVRAINCPNCGAATTVRTFGHAVNVVCQNCKSILDTRDEGVRILQKYKDATPHEPLIPLGSRGTLAGVESEVVGFQVRQITVDHIAYQWREYLLFNPYRGFRYLSEYAGHWNLIATLRSLPEGDHLPGDSGTRTLADRTFKHFQSAVATTIFVLGEFPWQIRVGDKATVVDYVAPPRMLSAEVTTDKEVTWSLGDYTNGKDIWSAFSLVGNPPRPEGVFADQPSPYAGLPTRMWRLWMVFVALALVLWLAHEASARATTVFKQTYTFDPRPVQDASLVTPTFELDGRPSAVRVETDTNVANQWMTVGYALVNNDTGQSYEFEREVSFYSGVEDGEAWSEGARTDDVTLPSIPAGTYFLRIEPEGDRTGKPVRYGVTVVRDVATSLWFLGAFVLLLIPPILAQMRAGGFENRRWQESDHGTSSSSDDDDDDDSGGDDSND